jgi:hypothetical protein
MKELQFTPGPWVASFRPAKDDYYIIGRYNDGGQIFIGEVYNADADEQRDANANLIAASPEMYEALKQIVNGYNKGIEQLGRVCMTTELLLAIDRLAIPLLSKLNSPKPT